MKFIKLFFIIGVICFFNFCLLNIGFASKTEGTINSSYRYAWGENIGWLDFGRSDVSITDLSVTGNIYGENVGWINLNLINTPTGDLSGKAWGENIGWLDFNNVSIDNHGLFTGSAYGENVGWINFGATTNKVSTDWRPAIVRQPIILSTNTQNIFIKGIDSSADSFTVMLASIPSDNVIITPTLSSQIATLSTSQLTFTSDNWNVPQTIIVYPISNNIINSTANLTFTITSDDENYNLLQTTASTTVVVNFTKTYNTASGGSTSGCTGLCGNTSTNNQNNINVPVTTIPNLPKENVAVKDLIVIKGNNELNIKPEEIVTKPTAENISTILESLNIVRNVNKEENAISRVAMDTKEFGVSANESQLKTMSLFVSYGVSGETVKLGEGERRSVIRDYLDTIKTADINWQDVEKISTGKKPVSRNLNYEQEQVSDTLLMFKKVTGHNPNFKNKADDLAWNTMMYRIRFQRDLVKEREAIGTFKQTFFKSPKTPLDWAVIRSIAYTGIK
jgi:hypothetical protein